MVIVDKMGSSDYCESDSNKKFNWTRLLYFGIGTLLILSLATAFVVINDN